MHKILWFLQGHVTIRMLTCQCHFEICICYCISYWYPEFIVPSDDPGPLTALKWSKTTIGPCCGWETVLWICIVMKQVGQRANFDNLKSVLVIHLDQVTEVIPLKNVHSLRLFNRSSKSCAFRMREQSSWIIAHWSVWDTLLIESLIVAIN